MKKEKKPTTELKTEMILIRATKKEKAEIEKLAKKDKRTVSNYAISKMLDEKGDK